MKLWRWLRRKSKEDAPEQQPERTQVMDLGNDPLNPHGDGTLRPGDLMFDAMMEGDVIFGERRPDGKWNVQRIPPEGEAS